MQILGPGVSGLTSVPLTTEGARRQADFKKNMLWSFFFYLQWKNIKKKTFYVPFSIRLMQKCQHLYMYLIFICLHFYSSTYFTLILYFFSLLLRLYFSEHKLLYNIPCPSICETAQKQNTAVQYRVMSLCEKAPEAVSFFKLRKITLSAGI